jgi:hypothetical protein
MDHPNVLVDLDGIEGAESVAAIPERRNADRVIYADNLEGGRFA